MLSTFDSRAALRRACLAALLVFAVPAVLDSCGNGNGNGAITASGTVEVTEVSVAAKSGGQIVRMFVDEGARVNRGDTLAIIDTTEYALNYRQAIAAVDVASAQLLVMEHGSRSEDVEQAASLALQAKVQLDNAKADADRIRTLAANHTASPKQLEDALARFQAAQAGYNAAQQMADKVRRGARSEDIAAARAHVAQARAQADLLAKKLADCIVTFPVAGTVTHRLADDGEMIAPNAPVVVVSELDSVKLTIYVTDRELGRVTLGQHADVSIDAVHDRTFPGVVMYVSPTAEFTPKNVQTKEDREKLVFAVKIRVPNADGRLKPGMPADAVLR